MFYRSLKLKILTTYKNKVFYPESAAQLLQHRKYLVQQYILP